MDTRKYYVALATTDIIIARGMDLHTALLLIEAWAEKYYEERTCLRICEEVEDSE